MQEDYKNYYDLALKVKEHALGAMTKVAYDTWIAPLEIASIKDNTVNFLVPTEFYREFTKTL